MYRRRAYSRSYSRVKRAKYSNETNAMNVDLSTEATTTAAFRQGELSMMLVAASDNQGMRKAKNFDLSLQTNSMGVPVHFALVYVPEGQTPSRMTLPATCVNYESSPSSIYEPNQNVIMSGVMPGSTGNPIHFRTRLARNLNSGDAIYLCVEPAFAPSEGQTYGQIDAQLNFAICY